MLKKKLEINNTSKKEYYRFKGRMGRENYILTVLGLLFIQFLTYYSLFLIYLHLGDSISANSYDFSFFGFMMYLSFSESLLGSLFNLVAKIIFSISVGGLYATYLRFHDLGKSGWNSILVLIPGFNIILIIKLFFIKGEERENKYGFPPREILSQWSLFLCLRYLSRKRIVLLSVAAVMLCCALLITVASLFTGFISAFENSAADYMGDIVLSRGASQIEDLPELLTRIDQVPSVAASTPVLEGGGLLLTGPGQVRAVQVLGIDLKSRLNVSPLKKALVRQSSLPDDTISFTPQGQAADTTGGFVGIGLIASPDELTDTYDMKLVDSAIGGKAVLTTGSLAAAQETKTQEAEPRFVRKVLRFTIADVVQTGVHELDKNCVYVPIDSLGALLYPDKNICADSIQIRLKAGANLEKAAAMIRGLVLEYSQKGISWAQGAEVQTSRAMQARMIAEYKKQLNMLMLIFGIVSFGVVLLVFCIFYLIVMTKQKDIAVAKSCGASSISVAGLYLFFGFVNGVLGSALGAILGWMITRNIESVEKGITALTGLKIWKASTYMFSQMPNQVNWQWAFWICVAALAAASIGALIPAIAAARIRPVKILRYE